MSDIIEAAVDFAVERGPGIAASYFGGPLGAAAYAGATGGNPITAGLTSWAGGNFSDALGAAGDFGGGAGGDGFDFSYDEALNFDPAADYTGDPFTSGGYEAASGGAGATSGLEGYGGGSADTYSGPAGGGTSGLEGYEGGDPPSWQDTAKDWGKKALEFGKTPVGQQLVGALAGKALSPDAPDFSGLYPRNSSFNAANASSALPGAAGDRATRGRVTYASGMNRDAPISDGAMAGTVGGAINTRRQRPTEFASAQETVRWGDPSIKGV